MWNIAGKLTPRPALTQLDLLAAPVAKAVADLPEVDQLGVVDIDPTLADTAEFCAAYDVPLAASANCVVVAGKRGEVTRYAACLVLATMRADVNGVVRRALDARKASFAPMDDAVALTGMEYGGITPIGLPNDWLLLISPEVAAIPEVVIGSGIRASKIFAPGPVLAKLPGAVVVTGVAK